MIRLGWVLAGTVMLFSGAVAGEPKKLNFLWLIAEDLGPHLGCFGTREVWTPNLDRLAREGMLFRRFFVTAPVCSPSRSAFMTGMYQTSIGAHHHRSHRDDGYTLPPGVRLATDWMRDLGYFTANLRQFPRGIELGPSVLNVGSGKTDWNFTYYGRPFDTDRWEDLKIHQPFFAQINFHETHRPFRSPRRADPTKVEIPPYYPDHPVTRTDWAQYLDAVSELDVRIGAILRLLERDGLADNTVIFFFADNGQAHVRGKQFCYDSGLHVPLIIYWPRGLAVPPHYRPGTVSEQLVSAIDLLPTMLSLAGGNKPMLMQGRIFLGRQADPPRTYVFGARDRCDETVFRFRTVRDSRYRYIRNYTPDRPFLQPNAYKEKQYPVWSLLKQLDQEGKLTPVQKFLTAPTMPPEELYDTLTDPYETHNLAASPLPEHQQALLRLRTALDVWLMETDDQGRFPEPPEVARAKGATQPGTNPNRPAIFDKPPSDKP
ncbi:MAG: sulfatase [Gemmatales bacterium]|nr:sulfatase [Gemmatales bacterium]MDW8175015.1 sulfatase [Gemmatales bacterium]